MSASGPTSLPPGLRASETYAPQALTRPVEVVSAPPAREEERGRTRHLRGEILGREDSGQIRIRTDRGEIRIRVDPQAPPLEEGRRVDVEIPPGDLPRQAFVKILPAKAVEAPASPGPAPEDADRVSVADSFYFPKRANLQDAPPSLPVQGVLAEAEGLVVRLVFLPPAQLLRQTQISPVSLFQTTLSPDVFFPDAGTDSASGILPAVFPESPFFSFSFLEDFSEEIQTQSLSPVRVFPSFQTVFPAVPEILSASDGSMKGDIVWSVPAASERQTELPASFEGLFPRLASGHVFPEIDLITTTAQALSDPMAQRVPAQIDLRNLKVDGSSIRIGAIPGASGMRPSPVFFQPPAGPEGILRGAAGTLGGRVVASPGPEGRPVLALFLPGSPFAHFFTLQTDGLFLSEGAEFEAFALKSPEGPISSLLVPARLDVPSPLWPAVDDLFQALSAADPQIAQVLARTIPNPAHPALSGPAVLFFIAALRAGDMAGWIGEKALDALRRAGKTDLLTRLGRDVASLSESAARETDEGGWKSQALPFIWENRVQRAVLHYRSAGEGDEGTQGDQKGSKSARFVFDLAFNRLGNVQLDGLYRDRRLDVALRTVAPLSEAMRQTLRARFAEGLAQAGIVGDVYFQNDPETFLKIPTREKPRSAWV